MTAVPISITESQCYAALRNFLLAILPPGVEVVQGQNNRVPEPLSTDFVTMTTVFRERLGTNVTGYADTAYTASITATTMTVTAMEIGTIALQTTIYGTGVAAGTVVAAFGTGTGGVGTYSVTPSQNVASIEMASGVRQDLMMTKWTVQLDVHGPNSSDNIQTIEALFRSSYGCDAFSSSGIDITPLDTGIAHQLPFVNEAQQVEIRWVLDLELQVNPILTTPQQYFDQAVVGLIEVDTAYPLT